MVGTESGVHAMPRSSSLESNCVTQMPARSPCEIELTGSWNICIDLTFLDTFKVGNSIIYSECE